MAAAKKTLVKKTKGTGAGTATRTAAELAAAVIFKKKGANSNFRGFCRKIPNNIVF